MQVKLSESTLHKRTPSNLEEKLNSHRQGISNSKPFHTTINNNGRNKNLNNLSSKIEDMEKRLKKRDLSTSEIFNSSCGDKERLKGSKKDGKLKMSKKLTEVNMLSTEALRSSWEGGSNFGFWADKEAKKGEKPNTNKNNPLAQFYRSTCDVNPEYRKNSINLTGNESLRLGIPQSYEELKKDSYRLFKNKTMTESQEIDEKTGQQDDPKGNTVKNRIKKSMEMIEMMKNQDNTKKAPIKKQRSKLKESIIVNGFSMGVQLGKGKFGDVYLAKHIQTGFIVAIKKLTKQKLQQFKMENQFIKEIKLHNMFDHPNIVKFYGVFEDRESFYIILEYMNGGTLFEHQNVVQCLPIKETVDYLREIIEALTHMHDRSIAHRDLKPENIVLTTEGVAKVCDFGWAAMVDKNRKTFCGTLQYVSPQVLEMKEYDTSVDIWSIGILAYEMLMGHAPFEDKDRSVVKRMILNVNNSQFQYGQNVPVEARQFIEWLVQKDPLKRPRIRELLSHQLFSKYGSSKGNSKKQ